MSCAWGFLCLCRSVFLFLLPSLHIAEHLFGTLPIWTPIHSNFSSCPTDRDRHRVPKSRKVLLIPMSWREKLGMCVLPLGIRPRNTVSHTEVMCKLDPVLYTFEHMDD